MTSDPRQTTHGTQFIVGNIGNTTGEFALVAGGTMGPVERLRTAELLGGTTPAVIQAHPEIPQWIATVVPDARNLSFLRHANWVVAASCPTIDFSAVDTSTLGADRVANSAGAARLLTLPALIIDCGTAITFELIDSSRAFLGGAILPGRALLRSALHSGTAQLPEVPLDCTVPSGPGKTTADAMAIGLDQGVIGAVEAVRNHILACCTEPVTTYVTGGDAAFFLSRLQDTEAVPADFTLKGVMAIAEDSVIS